MTPRRFFQCDVFTPSPTYGNALAVVIDSEGLTDVQMQQFAAWTNLAETTFLLPPSEPQADYRVRIFTPYQELPFAGHPTLGSCTAWLHSGGVPREAGRVYQECGVGIVEVDIGGQNELAFKAPPTRIAPLGEERLAAIEETLHISHEDVVGTAHLDNGPQWQVLELRSADAVLAIDASRLGNRLAPIGLIGPYPQGADSDYEVRMLAPRTGEDPITGSLNSALAHWLQSQGRLERAVRVTQGTAMGRQGKVIMRPDGSGAGVWVGGQVHTLIEGTVRL